MLTEIDGRERELEPSVAREYQPFDFAYALTCQ